MLTLLLATSLLIAACGAGGQGGAPAGGGGSGDDGSGTAGEPVRIALFGLVRANEYEQARVEGAEAKAAELGATVDYFSAEFDTQEQINQIQDAMTSGRYDAFIIHPNDSNAVVPVVEEAIAEGYVVIAADGPIGPNTRSLEPYPEGLTATVGRTGWSTGTWLGRAVVDACQGIDPCEVAYLIGAQALTIDQDRYEALEQVIAEHDHIQVVAFQEGQYRRDLSQEVMQNVFQANPGIDVVVSSGDQMTLGALDAAQDAGIADQIKFIGNGASKQGCEAVQNGTFYATYADIPYTQGEVAVELAVKAVRGEEVPGSVNLEELSPPLPSTGPMITQEALEAFTCQW